VDSEEQNEVNWGWAIVVGGRSELNVCVHDEAWQVSANQLLSVHYDRQEDALEDIIRLQSWAVDWLLRR